MSEHDTNKPITKKPLQGGDANRPVTESGAGAATEVEATTPPSEIPAKASSTPNPTASTLNAGSSDR